MTASWLEAAPLPRDHDWLQCVGQARSVYCGGRMIPRGDSTRSSKIAIGVKPCELVRSERNDRVARRVAAVAARLVADVAGEEQRDQSEQRARAAERDRLRRA